MELAWDSVQGHTENKARLRRFLREQRLPHALLLQGKKGIGKSRIAEVLAAAVLCKDQRDGQACGVCESCRALQMGIHPDFYRVVPESNSKTQAAPAIKIEAIRELQGELSRIPKMSQGRAVILEDTELMNEAAANALLKTLEEPVGVVYFFLLTAARQALLPTIISRCMPLQLLPLQETELRAVLLEQGHKAEEIESVLTQAEGSPGVALELLANGAETLELALSLLELVRQRDELALWEKAKELRDMKRTPAGAVLGKLRLLLRDLLALAEGSMPLSGVAKGRLEKLRPFWRKEALLAALQLTAENEKRLISSNVNVRLALEGYLLRMSALV